MPNSTVTPVTLYRAVLLAFGLVVAGLVFEQIITLVLAVLIVVIIATPLSAFASLLQRVRVPRAIGGLLGLLLGWSISRAAGLVFPNLPTAVPLWAAASGVAVSVCVGLFFGIWPASRAARLDPVEALRHE